MEAMVFSFNRRGRHPEVRATSASLEGWPRGACGASFEARKGANLRMTAVYVA
jgi:hypothetical protein